MGVGVGVAGGGVDKVMRLAQGTEPSLAKGPQACSLTLSQPVPFLGTKGVLKIQITDFKRPS